MLALSVIRVLQDLVQSQTACACLVYAPAKNTRCTKTERAVRVLLHFLYAMIPSPLFSYLIIMQSILYRPDYALFETNILLVAYTIKIYISLHV